MKGSGLILVIAIKLEKETMKLMGSFEHKLLNISLS